MRLAIPIGLLVLGLLAAPAAAQDSRHSESRPASASQPQRFAPRTSGPPQLLVRLERKPCYGTCPVYTLKITDDGVVSYSGKKHVAMRGAGASWLDPRRFDRLVRAIIDLRFEELEDRYVHEDWTDHSSATLEINLNGRSKTIEHYHGNSYAPTSLTRFEDLIDEIAESDSWVYTLQQRAEMALRKADCERASTRSETRPGAIEFLDRQFAATAELGSFGAIARIDPDGRTVVLRLDAGKSATFGSKLIVLQDRAYAARVRVTAVDASAPQAVVEHLEPGVTLAPGDLVWDRSP